MTASIPDSTLTNLCLMLKIDLDMPAGVRAFSTLRGGGGPYSTPYHNFNVCRYTGDDLLHAAICAEILRRHLGVAAEAIVMPRQTHSDRVMTVESVPADAAALEGVDALVTDRRGVALCVNTADCVPVALADTVAGVIAVAHCGWRGVVNDLLPNTIAAMKRLGAEPGRIRASMGPSICPRCFEVGEEVASQFRSRWPVSVIDMGSGKPHVNLAAAIRCRLTADGLTDSNITDPGDCTHCTPQHFFSARREGVESGRMLTVVMLD